MAASPAGAAARPQFRNSLGQPDFEGVWTSLTGTPFERPKDFKSQWATVEEGKAFLAKQAAGPPPEADKVGQFTSEWFDFGPMTEIGGRVLTSSIVDPPDGRLPYSTDGRAVMEAVVKRTEEDTDNPEGRDIVERCLYSLGGPPLGSVSLGSLFRIVQTRGQVAIESELMHDVRFIDLGRGAERPPPPSWTGTSLGRFEGETLVVETAGFHPLLTIRVGDFYLSPKARVRERFRRMSEAEILYEFEIEDLAVYTQVWRAMMVLRRTDAAMYEYACHEGNYGMANILAGAREEEKKPPPAGGKPASGGQ